MRHELDGVRSLSAYAARRPSYAIVVVIVSIDSKDVERDAFQVLQLLNACLDGVNRIPVKHE